MNKTSIEWTHRPETRGEAGGMTWNPIRARLKNPTHLGDGGGKIVRPNSGTFCTRISPGCVNCYASTINRRFGNGLEFTVPNLEKIEFFIDERILQEPLKQKKPCTIFVGDMFDLFHAAIPNELINQVFNVALRCPQHTFQFLTKRVQRLHDYLTHDAHDGGFCWDADACPVPFKSPESCTWFWFGASIEDQKRADERTPLLLQTPAAVRFLSVEPMLEPVNVSRYMWPAHWHWDAKYKTPQDALAAGAYAERKPQALMASGVPMVNWVICGGESGAGARPFDQKWAEVLLAQCRDSKVPFFMKQMGTKPHNGRTYVQPPDHEPGEWVEPWLNLSDRKGGDPSEWPEALRVREFPVVREAVTA